MPLKPPPAPPKATQHLSPQEFVKKGVASAGWIVFGPKGNPTATNLFNIIACLQAHEGVRLQVVA